jgi:hypothetical protein
MRTQEGSRFVTRDEYLASEARAETRREYVAGTLRAMAGASPEHVAICFNLGCEVRQGLRVHCTLRLADIYEDVEFGLSSDESHEQSD